MYVFYVLEINLSIFVYLEVSLLFSLLGEFYRHQLVVQKVAKTANNVCPLNSCPIREQKEISFSKTY